MQIEYERAALRAAVRLSEQVTRYPKEMGLLEQMRRQDLKLPPALPAYFDEAPAGPSGTGVAGDAEGVSTTPQVQAQQLKILRVLRFMVLPEMAKRLLDD